MYSLVTITTILILKSSITLQILMYRLVINVFPQSLATNDFFSFRIILPYPQCYINGIRQYVAFGVWLLSCSIIHLTFIGVAFVSSSFLFITEKYFIVWISSLFTHSPVERRLFSVLCYYKYSHSIMSLLFLENIKGWWEKYIVYVWEWGQGSLRPKMLLEQVSAVNWYKWAHQ